MKDQDEKLMLSALKLAERGIGAVEPNPAVGCIITKAGQIIGKGYHKKHGDPHAEINAIADCRRLGIRPEGGTMYVTLEPCCHEGQTGPCTKAIMEAGIARVVAATTDPSPHAAGRGFQQLREAGIEVEEGLCDVEARRLNAPFFKYVTTGRCWVIVKWAQSLDGKLAYAGQSPEQRWITNELSRKDAHRLRRRAGAVVVGIETVLADDPLLTPRPSKGRKPIRVALDNTLRIPLKSRLLRTPKTSRVLVVARQAAAEAEAKHAERIRKRGVEILTCPDDRPNSNLRLLLDELSQRGVQQVLVEGGPRVLTSFLRERLADEVCVYVAPRILGADGAVYIGEPMADALGRVGLAHVVVKIFDGDVRISGRLEKGSASATTAPNGGFQA